MAIQPQNNNLNYLIDPTFTNVNGLFTMQVITESLFHITIYQMLK